MLAVFMGAVLAAGMSAASLAGFERDPAPGTRRVSDSPSPAAADKPAAAASTAAAPAAAPLSAIPAFFEARARAVELAARLSEAALDELTVAEAAETAARLVGESAAAALTTRKAIAQLLPDAASYSAMLAGERDLGDFRASAAAGGRAGKAYARMAERHEELLPLRSRYEALAAGAWAAHRAARAADAASVAAAPGLVAADPASAAAILHRAPSAPPPAHPVGRKGTIYKPPLRALDKTHPFALDIFFTSFEHLGGGVERGPEVLSASAGLVVASSRDWKGGAGQDSYVSGGFSPRSGNGVIVYDPLGRRYFSYFHLFDLAVETGDLVEPGSVLGRGGDTGINARRDGHGGHVHVEIFDARSGRPLKALEIRKIIFP